MDDRSRVALAALNVLDLGTETTHHNRFFVAALEVVIEGVLAFLAGLKLGSVNRMDLDPLPFRRCLSAGRKGSSRFAVAPLNVLNRNMVVLVATPEDLALVFDGGGSPDVGDE